MNTPRQFPRPRPNRVTDRCPKQPCPRRQATRLPYSAGGEWRQRIARNFWSSLDDQFPGATRAPTEREFDRKQ